jgi:hypothetical protein
MPTFVTKLAPQAILLAFAIYWSWPSLTQSISNTASSTVKDKKGGSPLDFSAAVLSPTFPSPPKRDLFELPGAAHLAKNKRGKSKSGKAAGLKGAAFSLADAKDSGLVLSATCIVGRQRLALINGQVYKEKDTIKGKGSGDDPINWVITDILPHKVLLLHQGTPLQLNYPNGAEKSASKSDADKSSPHVMK